MTREKILRHHSLYSYLKAILGSQQFMGPILVLYYMNYIGLTFSQYCLIDSALFFVVAISEIPSGYIADKFGRKKILLLSQWLTLISFIIPIITRNFAGAFIGIIILGLASSLGSGNDHAILFESLKNKFKDVISKSSTISLTISVVTSFISGFIFKVNMLLPVILDIICLLLTIIITYKFLHDDESYIKNTKKFIKYNFKINIREFTALKNVLLFFLIDAIMFAILRTSYTFYQPIFKNVNIPVEYFGIIFSIINIISAISSYVSNKIDKSFINDTRITYFFCIFLLISVLGVNYFSNNLILLLFIFIQQIVRGIYIPYFGIYRNYYIPPKSTKRTTYLSVCSFMSTIITSISLNLSSLFSTKFTTTTSMLYINLILILVLSIINYLNFYYKKKGSIICYQDQ